MMQKYFIRGFAVCAALAVGSLSGALLGQAPAAAPALRSPPFDRHRRSRTSFSSSSRQSQDRNVGRRGSREYGIPSLWPT